MSQPGGGFDDAEHLAAAANSAANDEFFSQGDR
jgi:hypothetical protein